jgi:hypothetical protein
LGVVCYRLQAELGLEPKTAKVRSVYLDVGGDGFAFSGSTMGWSARGEMREGDDPDP